MDKRVQGACGQISYISPTKGREWLIIATWYHVDLAGLPKVPANCPSLFNAWLLPQDYQEWVKEEPSP